MWSDLRPGVILETGQHPEDTKKEHFRTTKKLKRAPLIWPLLIFIASLQLFRWNKFLKKKFIEGSILSCSLK